MISTFSFFPGIFSSSLSFCSVSFIAGMCASPYLYYGIASRGCWTLYVRYVNCVYPCVWICLCVGFCALLMCFVFAFHAFACSSFLVCSFYYIVIFIMHNVWLLPSFLQRVKMPAVACVSIFPIRLFGAFGCDCLHKFCFYFDFSSSSSSSSSLFFSYFRGEKEPLLR